MKKQRSLFARIVSVCLIVFLVSFLLLTGGVLFVGKASFDFAGDDHAPAQYSSVMADNISGDPRVVDIAMLGAHDAFSHHISADSPIDPQEGEDSILRNGAAQIFANGMFSRLAKAQRMGAGDMLRRGVRYFDVRVTRYKGEWYTTHGLLSDRLQPYLVDTIEFLSQNPGEILVFDIQHAFTDQLPYTDLFDYIASVKHQGKSLFDFVGYSPDTTALASLTYRSVTASGAAVVVLAKSPQFEGCFHYDYSSSIRSTWHQQNSVDAIIPLIEAEHQYLLTNPQPDIFRVNQAQLSANYSDILTTILDWSLLDMANASNPKILAHPQAPSWLTTMPILMLDNTTTPSTTIQALSLINTHNANF